jgi:hypothetical protein
MDDQTPSPVERELWEALDGLLKLWEPNGYSSKSTTKARLTVARHVRDRLRPLMNEGKPK